MRRSLIAVFCALLPLVAAGVTPQEEIDQKVPLALEKLKKWEQSSPQKSQRKLHIVYWTPRDRRPAPRYAERLTSILEDIRDFYASEMQRMGFGPRTIGLEYASDGMLKIHVVKGRKDYAAYNVNSGGEIRKECLPTLRAAGLDPNRETVVIFCNMSNWDEKKSRISQNSPYYAGGSHRNGTAWQVDSPILELSALKKKKPKVHDGQYGHISIGRYNTIFIGGVCHELGHALGLPHNRERPDEREVFGTALMGSGNRTYGEERRDEGRGSFLTLSSALRLASHPMFSGSVKQMERGSKAKVRSLKVESFEKGFRVTGKVTADPAPYAVIGYMDPQCGGDYDATTCSAIPDEEGNFILEANALVPGENQEFRIVVCQVNGACSTYIGSNSCWEIPYRVEADGSVDLSQYEATIRLEHVIDRVNAGDRSGSAREFEKLKTEEPADDVVAIATALLGTLDDERWEDALSFEGSELSLSQARPKKSHVGWAKPTFDRVPDPSALLRAGDRIYPQGIYAHANAHHVWMLGGKWKRLKGEAGLSAVNSRGTCVFKILGDGRELWRSGKLTAGKLGTYDVDLTGVKKLELHVRDGGDGRGGDWGLWLNPMLSR